MKKAFSTLMMLAAVLTIAVACKKNDDSSGGGGTYAATPTPGPAQNCVDASNPNCVPTQPNYYAQNAPQFTNYQWSYTNGFCGCPVGFRPVMNFNWGLSCAPNYWFPGSEYYMTYNIQTFYYPPQNGQWTNIPLVTYSPATSGNVSSCSAAAAICDTRATNPCGNGQVCRQAAGGSYLGLCTSGTGNDNYQAPPPNNNCRTVNYGSAWVTYCSYGFNSYYYSGAGNGMLPR